MKNLISGKVREVYEISEDQLVIVTTDRISAFDVLLSKPVPNKGRVLNEIAMFWFNYTKDIVPNHILSDNLEDMPAYFQKSEFEKRTILVKKLKMLPFECVIRGYMFGNMWEAYKGNREFCGQKLEGNYQLAGKLDSPVFTPSTKAHTGHDEYISYKSVEDMIGENTANRIKNLSIELYETCYNYAYSKGIIIADTKFEFGLDESGDLVLADEIFTPDSSRFWSLSDYKAGSSPKSYDKQFVRDWLLNNKEKGKMRFDSVPDDVVTKTSEIYHECFRRLCSNV